MKRKDLLEYLATQQCLLIREGGNHSVYQNQQNKQKAPVPRHAEIHYKIVRKICKELGIPVLEGK